ncbi:MAG: hypothetical protein RL514_3104 [Verrucomicrobiota bacterium]|jgi:hypothetical protein
MANPKETGDWLAKLVKAWKENAAEKQFAGMTLAQFEAKVKPSFDARDAVAGLEAKLVTALNTREDADKLSVPEAQLVVNSVKGDPNFGEDSSLYEAMGYVRKSERKSGLKKGKKPTPPA